MISFTTFSLWLHLIAIVLWVGGLFAIAFGFIPVLRKGTDSASAAARLTATALGRFQRISRELVFLILLTGIFNVINAGVARGFAPGSLPRPSWSEEGAR